MGCKRLDTDFYFSLEVVHSQKMNCTQKKRLRYYPFGLQHKYGPNDPRSLITGVQHPWGYNSKEEQNELGLNVLDYGARVFDPAAVVWWQSDPLAEAQYEYSPYHYTYNNPIMYNDPTGMMGERANYFATDVVNEDTGEKYHVEDGYDFEFSVSNDEFNQIKEDGAINKGTSAYNRWFWAAVWNDLTTSDGSVSDEVTQFMITDEIEDGIETANEISNGNYTTAVLTLLLRKVQKGKKGYNLVKKLFKNGKKGKLPTPNLARDQFDKVGDKFVHKKTGAIYKKSHTSHGNVDNVGEQWKAWPKGTTDFGKTSKTTGTRVTIDGNGDVIGN